MSVRARVRLAFGAIVLAGVLLGSGCRAVSVPEPSPNSPSSADLIDAPKRHDGTEVTFTGEAIGEAMVRGKVAWLHLNDDSYYIKNVEEGAELGGYNTGMPVWLSAEDARRVTHFGDYKHEGDIVRVRGVFNAACAEHGGDMDIHAGSLEVITPGHAVVDPVHPDKVVWAVGLSLLAVGLYIAARGKERATERTGR